MTLALHIKELRSGYGQMQILRGVSLDVEQGQIHAIVGKNGAGKSTLLKTIFGLLPVTSGEVAVLGRSILNSRSRQSFRSVSYAPQEGGVFSDLTVIENIKLGGIGLSSRTIASELPRVIDMFPVLGRREGQKAGTLSGGEKGMLKVARALLRRPDFVVFDEVTEGLQPSVIDSIAEIIQEECASRKVTILLVEQNLDFVLNIASRFSLMERGGIVSEEHIDDPETSDRVRRHLAL